jgi:hypothetical protein
VHLPISLGLLGLPLIFVALLAPKRSPNVRLFAGAFFFMTSLIALAAVLTGERAGAELVALASDEIESVVAQHRLLGFAMMTLAFVTSALFIASWFRGQAGGRVLAAIAALTAVGLFAVVFFTASSGGRLVYGFGIGTPIAGVDGASGATAIVGAYPASAAATVPPTVTFRPLEESAEALYTPNIRPIDPAQAAAITFETGIRPLLERHCVTCHSGTESKAGLNLTTHGGILAGGDYAGPAALPTNPDASPMVLHIRGIYQPKMPKDAQELSEDELHTVRMWIAAGAKGE